MIVYAESSAILAWLLAESRAADVRAALSGAERVVASTLTPLECARALERGAASGRIGEADSLAARRLLDEAVKSWVLLDMAGAALQRAARRFPHEPVRTLDAIHLATALEFHDAVPHLALLSLDDRVRANATALGLATAPLPLTSGS